MTDLGKILIMPKGAWSNAVTYEILDSVTHDGASYISKVNNNLNHTPSGATDNYWFKYAEDGFSPTITAVAGTDKVTITITNKTGSPQSFDINDGEDGNGIASSSVTYQQGTSATTVPSGTWEANPPTVDQGKYLWTRLVLIFDDTTTKTLYSIAYQGQDGNGVDSSSSSVTYQQGDSGTTPPVGTWLNAPPTVDKGKYLWTRTIITYTDTTTSTIYSVAYQGQDGTGIGDMLKSTYDTDDDGKVNAAESADSVEWSNVQNKPFSAVGSTLEVTNIEVEGVNIPTVNAKTMTGATSSTVGTKGLVPAPASGDEDKVLKGDGTWGEVSGLGKKLTATVSGNTVSFTDSSISETSIIHNLCVADVLMAVTNVSISETTVTYTFANSEANGKSAIVYVIN